MAKKLMQHEKSRVMAAKKANILELYIYGSIGTSWYDEGVGAADVAKALAEAGSVTGIKLRINSPGGSVFEGSAIYSLLQSKGVPIEVVVDGLAASAAFTIAMVGTTINISESAMMMCHNAWGMCVGEAKDMIREAALLEQINGVMASIYAKRSGQTLEDVAALMDAETWLTPQDAVDKGFASAIMKPASDESSAKAVVARWDMSKFARAVPDALKADDTEDCMCPCPACLLGDCENCTTDDCDYEGCDHSEDDETGMKVEPVIEGTAEPDFSLYDRRLRLAGLGK